MFLRTDRVAQFAVRYFMGMEGYSFEEYMSLISKYSEQKTGEPEGALIIFADDTDMWAPMAGSALNSTTSPTMFLKERPSQKTITSD